MSFQGVPSNIAAGLLLHRIGQELGGCRALLVKVENAVETLLLSGNVAADDPLHIVEMQNIDLLDQILADLMLFLQDLAEAEPLSQPVALPAVMSRLRLAALRNRLSGMTEVPDEGDSVELF